MRLMTRIRAFAKENHIVVRLEELKKTIAERAERNRFVRFVFALQEKNRTMGESLREYLDVWRKRTGEMVRKATKRKSARSLSDHTETTRENPAQNDHTEGGT